MGSSPRVWGQDVLESFSSNSVRIIPTRVGTSLYGSDDLISTEDHPHACGDKRSLSSLSTLVKGSSPRVWGQVTILVAYVVWKRIIPTRVGTSIIIAILNLIIRDHPHACGDKPEWHIKGDCIPGSSPRVWGQAFHRTLGYAKHRIIPTRVGTSIVRLADIFQY